MGNDVHPEHKERHSKIPEDKNDVFYKEKINDAHTDFAHKDPIFDIEIEKKGPEFSEIDDQR